MTRIRVGVLAAAMCVAAGVACAREITAPPPLPDPPRPADLKFEQDVPLEGTALKGKVCSLPSIGAWMMRFPNDRGQGTLRTASEDKTAQAEFIFDLPGAGYGPMNQATFAIMTPRAAEVTRIQVATTFRTYVLEPWQFTAVRAKDGKKESGVIVQGQGVLSEALGSSIAGWRRNNWLVVRLFAHDQVVSEARFLLDPIGPQLQTLASGFFHCR